MGIQVLGGVIITCDAAVKEIILSLDRGGDIILEDLDSETLFVNESKLKYIHYEVQTILDQNAFKLDIDGGVNNNNNNNH
ncbi:hypothetical protein K502DRAFT_362290 [Neoconidiobolus thromboides FSU 785]|nr:hypothetical protein K502DRAFT_362290 [Neoconidiobolus thromboides FSU 785]